MSNEVVGKIKLYNSEVLMVEENVPLSFTCYEGRSEYNLFTALKQRHVPFEATTDKGSSPLHEGFYQPHSRGPVPVLIIAGRHMPLVGNSAFATPYASHKLLLRIIGIITHGHPMNRS